MPSSRNIAIVAVALGVAQAAAQQEDAKKPAKKTVVVKTGRKVEIDIPVPEGQPQKGVQVPIYDTDGKLRMRFDIGVGTWVDEVNVKLEKVRVATFKEDGSRDMDMDLPDAMLNKKTSIVTSNTPVSIKRDDFEVMGNTMSFNLESHEGTLGGGVKMLIYDRNEVNKQKEKKPVVEFQPAPKAQPKPEPNKK